MRRVYSMLYCMAKLISHLIRGLLYLLVLKNWSERCYEQIQRSDSLLLKFSVSCNFHLINKLNLNT
ncbi:hypothetical protein BHE74_00040455 [Ensete ventricosum]|uniref:Uncharacterized protein n=1 Tax=Ensete ventricosum TaxID=4639 RepID=A0A444GB04_ENSVE|nr:hypothetical protein B296_00053280 [Ensete ventricosum]RWW32041.1 hypothetical protein GW17_00003312 [Ensete ventricosum]RWW53086.1 hypothetical protein BHE74_00040455 [Ensete ventricosum]RZS16498.1 hypothetical protein BHM03_00048490 [Ensete ventricosum]